MYGELSNVKPAKLRYSAPPNSPRDYDIKLVRGFLKAMVGVRSSPEYRNILYAFDRLFQGDDGVVWFSKTADEMKFRDKLYAAHRALIDTHEGLRGSKKHAAIRKKVLDVLLDWPEPMTVQKVQYGPKPIVVVKAKNPIQLKASR